METHHDGGTADAAARAVEASPAYTGALSVGALLGAMSIRRVLSQTADEAVYVGFNEKLKRRFAVREYLPQALAHRGPGGLLELRSAADGATFLRGIQAFLEQAERRAALPQGVLLGVRRVWEENGTAYLCVPYPRAPTLAEVRAARTGPPDETWLRDRLLAPLLEALEQLHGASLWHGGLAPDKVLMLPEERTVLLDFASPPRGELAPGQAQDLRSLAALACFAIAGTAPPAEHAAPAEWLREALQRVGGPSFSDGLLATLDAVLTASDDAPLLGVQAFREALAGRAAPQAPALPVPVPVPVAVEEP
ncbi:MAG TPA: hypothetical protein VLA16_13390 [Ideonella sp.]|nr:hypothetical protein [Ideonella sp.]